MIKIAFTITAFIYGFVYLLIAAKTGKPFKTIFVFAFFGIITLIAINITSAYSGVYLPVNYISVGIVSSMGPVGTIGLLILKLIFI